MCCELKGLIITCAVIQEPFYLLLFRYKIEIVHSFSDVVAEDKSLSTARKSNNNDPDERHLWAGDAMESSIDQVFGSSQHSSK